MFEKYGSDPDTLRNAYATASALAEAEADFIGGWKLGATTAATRAAFNTDTVYFGALLKREIISVGFAIDSSLRPLRGEAEITLRVSRDLSPSEAVTIDDDLTLFDLFAPAIECPWSVVENLPEAGLAALVMDRCAAGLLLIGKARPPLLEDMDGALEILANGDLLTARTPSAGLLMSPIEAGCEAIRQIGSRGLSLGKGQWISTGGVTDCVDLPTSGSFELRYDGEVQFVATV